MKKEKNKHQQNAEQKPVNNHNPRTEQPKFVVMVPVFENGRIEVVNFPQEWTMEEVMQVLSCAMIRVAQHFRKKSDDKNLGRIIQLNQQQAAMIASKVKGH